MRLRQRFFLLFAVLAVFPLTQSDVFAQLLSSNTETFEFNFANNDGAVDPGATNMYLTSSSYDPFASGAPEAQAGFFDNAAFLTSAFSGPNFTEFHQFSLAAVLDDTVVDFTEITFDHEAAPVPDVGTTFQVRVEADVAGTNVFTSAPHFSTDGTDVSIDLSSISGIELDAGEEVVFRFAFADTGGFTEAIQSVSDISLAAEAIPEPSSMIVLASVGMLGLIRRRR